MTSFLLTAMKRAYLSDKNFNTKVDPCRAEKRLLWPTAYYKNAQSYQNCSVDNQSKLGLNYFLNSKKD